MFVGFFVPLCLIYMLQKYCITMSKIKNYKDFVNENSAPDVMPAEPTTKPGVRPGRPSPFKKPKIKQKPKAVSDDVIDKFNQIASDEDKKEVDSHYEEA